MNKENFKKYWWLYLLGVWGLIGLVKFFMCYSTHCLNRSRFGQSICERKKCNIFISILLGPLAPGKGCDVFLGVSGTPCTANK